MPRPSLTYWEERRLPIGQMFVHYIGVTLGFSSPRTQTTLDERAALAKHVRGRKCVVEVGVFEGLTTGHLCEHSDADAQVYGIDPFLPGRVGISWPLRICQLHNKATLRNGKLRLIRRTSPEIGDECPRGIDFIFIDADHSLEGIRQDWEFWSRQLLAGGIIALHDTIIQPNGPVAGSHQYFRSNISVDTRFDLIDQVDSLSVLRKR